jgi:HEAT repeat protein
LISERTVKGKGIMQDRFGSTSAGAQARQIYLAWVLATYGHITLPIDPEGRFPLERVYQPLQFRRAPDLSAAPSPPEIQANGSPDSHVLPAEEESRRDEPTSATRVEYVTDAAEALAHSPLPRVVILGGPGTGKTTVLRHLLARAAKRALAEDDAPLPLYIALPEWARSGLDFEDVVAHVLRDATATIDGREVRISPEFASHLTNEIALGQGLVCLDGLDEVPAADRLPLLAHTNATIAAAGGTWVIGSRFTEYKGQSFDPAQCTEWELVALDEHAQRDLVYQLTPFVQALIGGEGSSDAPSDAPSDASDDVADAYLAALAERPTVRSWGENPLLLSLGLAMFVRQQELPTSRAALYAAVVDALLATREPDAVAREQLVRVLAECALEVFIAYGRAFPLQAIADAASVAIVRTGATATPEPFQRVLASGLLTPMTQEAFGFVHQTVQEYLVGVALARGQFDPETAYRERVRQLITEKATRSRWGEPLRLMIGVLIQRGTPGSALAREWLRAFSERHETAAGDPGYLYLGLALRCVVEWEADAVLWSGAQQVIASWCEALQLAAGAGRTLVTDRLQRVLSDARPLTLPIARVFATQLVTQLDHPQPAVKMEAVRAAPVLGIEGMAVLKKALMLRDEYALRDVRIAAMSNLSGLGERSIPVLMAALRREDGMYASERLVEVLGVLAARLETPQRRNAVMRLLIWKLGDSREDRDGNALVKDAAQEALKPLFAMLAADEARQLIDYYFPMLAPVVDASHKQRTQRHIAIQVVGLLGAHLRDDEARRFIALLDEDEFLVKLEVANVLGALGPLLTPTEISHLIHMLTSTDFGERYGARHALEAVKDWIDEPGMHALVVLLAHGHHETREEAVSVLGAIGARLPADTLTALRQALDDDNEVVRHVAARALGAGGDSPSDAQLHALVTALAHPDWQVRLHAVEGLRPVARRLSETEMLAVLPLVTDEAWTVANEATYLLGARGARLSSTGIECLVESLHADTNHNRFAAVQALIPQVARLSDEQVLALMRTLGDSNEPVREAAARALGALRDRLEPDVWITWLAQQSGALRRMAAEALGLLGEQISDAGVRALMRGVQDQYSDVRVAALNALVPVVRRLLPPDHQLLIDIVGNEDRFGIECAAAVKVLAGLGLDLPESGRQAFLAVLMDTTSAYMGELRKAVVETLPRIGMRLSRDAWMTLLSDHDLGVQMIPVLYAFSDQVHEADVPFLLSAMEESGFQVGHAATYMLGALGDQLSDQGVRALIAALQEDLPFAAMEALSRVGSRLQAEVIAGLREVLKRQDDYVYFQALHVLRARGVSVDIADIPALAAQLASDDADQRAKAMPAFGSVELWPVAISESVLLNGLKDASAYVRQRAVEALEKLGEHLSPDAVQALVEALDDQESWVRSQIVSALRMVAPRLTTPQVQAVVGALHDEDRFVRYYAAETLGQVSEPIGSHGVQALKEAAASGDDSLRHEVYLALAHVGDQQDEPILIAGLEDHDAYARRGAAAALGTLGGRITHVGIHALTLALADEDAQVRKDAAHALGELSAYRGELGTQALIASLADDNEDVRQAAAHALGIAGQRTQVAERLETEAIRVLSQQPPVDIYRSRLQTQVVATIGNMGYAIPRYVRMLHESLDWPFWAVQRQTAQALGKLRRGIPDETILALLAKWQSREPMSVWKAVDAALASILAEDSIEG